MEAPTKVVTVSPASFGAMSRYMDAYRVANVVIKFGETIKMVGMVFGFLAIAASIVLLLDQKTGQGIAILGIVVGVIVGLMIYILGTLIAAQGQTLLASLDVAVCSSPFLSDEQRAKVMSLAVTEKIRYKMETESHDT